MKKFLLILMLTGLTITGVTAENVTPPHPQPDKMQAQRAQREAAFEARLGLTEAQKVQAREIHKKGFTEMKPVMDRMKAKKLEAETIRIEKDLTPEQKAKLNSIDKEIKQLQTKAKAIRKANMDEFEKILTPEQTETLKEMKAEGKKRYHEQHPHEHRGW